MIPLRVLISVAASKKDALRHAKSALRDVHGDLKDSLSSSQEEHLAEAEAELNKATRQYDYGELTKVSSESREK